MQGLHAYTTLLNELLLRRELDGELPEEVENSYSDRLDELWWRLTEEERSAFSGQSTPQAPKNLNLVDCKVELGSCTPPRKPTGDPDGGDSTDL